MIVFCYFFFSSRRRHTRCALVTGVQTCALPISIFRIIDLASLPGSLTGTAQAIQNGKPKQWAVTQTGVPVLQVDDRQALIVIRPSEPQQGAAEEFATGGDLHLDAVAVILPHANRRCALRDGPWRNKQRRQKQTRTQHKSGDSDRKSVVEGKRVSG